MDHNQTKKLFENWNVFVDDKKQVIKEQEVPPDTTLGGKSLELGLDPEYKKFRDDVITVYNTKYDEKLLIGAVFKLIVAYDLHRRLPKLKRKNIEQYEILKNDPIYRGMIRDLAKDYKFFVKDREQRQRRKNRRKGRGSKIDLFSIKPDFEGGFVRIGKALYGTGEKVYKLGKKAYDHVASWDTTDWVVVIVFMVLVPFIIEAGVLVPVGAAIGETAIGGFFVEILGGFAAAIFGSGIGALALRYMAGPYLAFLGKSAWFLTSMILLYFYEVVVLKMEDVYRDVFNMPKINRSGHKKLGEGLNNILNKTDVIDSLIQGAELDTPEQRKAWFDSLTPEEKKRFKQWKLNTEQDLSSLQKDVQGNKAFGVIAKRVKKFS